MMRRMKQSIDDIIDMLGGTGQVAEALDLADPSVSSWRARNSIPAVHWLALVKLGASQGKIVDLAWLAKQHARLPSRKAGHR